MHATVVKKSEKIKQFKKALMGHRGSMGDGHDIPLKQFIVSLFLLKTMCYVLWGGLMYLV